ncbi:MAG TPA: SRPBCC domain-containing protein [Spirochaetia bacterium]|nr:SRPBCC domain-containing protein [Spirochaetia bacterium]
MPQVIRSIEINASPSTVWRWMATQEALRQWLSPNLKIDLRVGGAYQIVNEDTLITGTVLEIIPEGELVLSWLEEGSEWVHPARLLVRLTPTAHGTQVTLSHDGFAGIGKSGWSKTVEAYERGADRHRILQLLAELVEAGSVHRQ